MTLRLIFGVLPWTLEDADLRWHVTCQSPSDIVPLESCLPILCMCTNAWLLVTGVLHNIVVFRVCLYNGVLCARLICLFSGYHAEGCRAPPIPCGYHAEGYHARTDTFKLTGYHVCRVTSPELPRSIQTSGYRRVITHAGSFYQVSSYFSFHPLIRRCFHNNHNFTTEPGAHRTEEHNALFPTEPGAHRTEPLNKPSLIMQFGLSHRTHGRNKSSLLRLFQ